MARSVLGRRMLVGLAGALPLIGSLAVPLGAHAAVTSGVLPAAEPAGRWLVQAPSGGVNTSTWSVSVDSVTGRLGFSGVEDGNPAGNMVVGELDAASGSPLWQVVIDNAQGSSVMAPGGDLVVTGTFTSPSSLGPGLSASTNGCFVARYQGATQRLLWASILPGRFPTNSCTASAVDALGDVYIAGSYSGPESVAGQSVTGQGIYLARLNGETGQAVWSHFFADSAAVVDALTVSGTEHLVVGGTYGYHNESLAFGPGAVLPPAPDWSDAPATYPWLAAFDATTGTALWAHGLIHSGDPNGATVQSLAVSGRTIGLTFSCCNPDLGGGPILMIQPQQGGVAAGFDLLTGRYLWSEGISSLQGIEPLTALTTDPAGDFVFGGNLPGDVIVSTPTNSVAADIPPDAQPGGGVVTGLISPADGALSGVVSAGGSSDYYSNAYTWIRSVAVDLNGHLYTGGAFKGATWDYGQYLPSGSTGTTVYGYIAG